MKLTIRGENIYGNAKTKHNNGDDYITFEVEPGDKDDRKYFQNLGFKRSYD